MKFDAKELCVIHQDSEYKVSVCFNGEFYQARIIHPPIPQWTEIGIGKTEKEAINSLMQKIEGLQAA